MFDPEESGGWYLEGNSDTSTSSGVETPVFY